uniref:Uncharacterized protein n=1 Tax=Anguilla anguilla TaxID=7936 RepID=A0A0E9X9X9_ANGAN
MLCVIDLPFLIQYTLTSLKGVYIFSLDKSKVQCKVLASIGTLPNVLCFTFHLKSSYVPHI